MDTAFVRTQDPSGKILFQGYSGTLIKLMERRNMKFFRILGDINPIILHGFHNFNSFPVHIWQMLRPPFHPVQRNYQDLSQEPY